MKDEQELDRYTRRRRYLRRKYYNVQIMGFEVDSEQLQAIYGRLSLWFHERKLTQSPLIKYNDAKYIEYFVPGLRTKFHIYHLKQCVLTFKEIIRGRGGSPVSHSCTVAA